MREIAGTWVVSCVDPSRFDFLLEVVLLFELLLSFSRLALSFSLSLSLESLSRSDSFLESAGTGFDGSAMSPPAKRQVQKKKTTNKQAFWYGRLWYIFLI
jgi:hypothetical protein